MLTAEVLQLSSPHVLCRHGQVAKLKLLAKNRKNQQLNEEIGLECCFVWECVVWDFCCCYLKGTEMHWESRNCKL